MNNGQKVKERNFVEEVGIAFEQTGLPRMAGRVFGWLLISDPPHQSTGQLVEALMASKGSISSMTRLLIQIGLIERTSLPGVRHDYFRIKPGASHQLLKNSLDQTTAFRQLLERGLELLEGKAHTNRQSLGEMHDLYAFLEQEFPALLEHWEQKHHKRSKLSVK